MRRSSRPVTKSRTRHSRAVEDRVRAIFERILPSSSRKARVLSHIAVDRLKRVLNDYLAEGATIGYAVLDTVRDVTFDNLTSSDFEQTLFRTTARSLATPITVSPLPDSAFSATTDAPPPGLAPYLASILPVEHHFLLQAVLYYGCLPEEADIIFGLPKTTSSRFVSKYIEAFGALKNTRHRGGKHCWPSSYLRFATKQKHPACRACLANTSHVRCLALMFAPEAVGSSSATARQEAPDIHPVQPEARISGSLRPIRIGRRPDSFFASVYRGAAAALAIGALVLGPLAILKSGEGRALAAETKVSASLPSAHGDKQGQSLGLCPSTGHFLSNGDTVKADFGDSLPVRLNTGSRLLLSAGSVMRVFRDRVELVSGEAAVDIPESAGGRLKLVCDAYNTTLSQGRYVAHSSGRLASLAVLHGDDTVLKLAACGDVSVGDKRKAVITDGNFSIDDLDDDLPDWMKSWVEELDRSDRLSRRVSRLIADSGSSWHMETFRKSSNRTRKQSRIYKGGGCSDFYRHLF